MRWLADSGIAATAHHNYIVSLPSAGGLLAAFSLSKSQAKKAKDFKRADAIRDELKVKGWVIEDTAQSPAMNTSPAIPP